MRCLLFILVCIAGASTAQPTGSPSHGFVDQVVRSTTVEWSDAFRSVGLSYQPPRVIVVQTPRGHPAGGSGYGGNLLVLDGRELGDILSKYGKDGEALSAIVIAHEVAHHAQRQLAERGGWASETGKAKELQADCAAGWWLARSSSRALRETGHATYSLPDMGRSLAQLLSTLGALNGRSTARDVTEDSISHGTVKERTDAITQGFRSNSLAACGIAEREEAGSER